MKNKKLTEGNTIYLVIIGVLVVILIILGILLFTSRRENKELNNSTNNTTNNTTNNGSSTSNDSQSLVNNICTKKVDEKEDYRVIYVETFKRDGERALSSQQSIRLECVNEEAYKRTKENKEFGDNVKFDDENFIIVYDNGEPEDYTKDENGNEINVLYTDIKQAFEEIDYICN